MAKLIVAFRNFANGPKIVIAICNILTILAKDMQNSERSLL